MTQEAVQTGHPNDEKIPAIWRTGRIRAHVNSKSNPVVYLHVRIMKDEMLSKRDIMFIRTMADRLHELCNIYEQQSKEVER